VKEHVLIGTTEVVGTSSARYWANIELNSGLLLGVIAAITGLAAVAVSLFVFLHKRYWERKRQWMEGRQFFRKAEALFQKTRRECQNGSTVGEGDEWEIDPYTEVLDLCQDAESLGFKESDLYYLLGLIYLEQERVGKAIEFLQTAVSRNASNIAPRYELALIYVDSQKDSKAKLELEAILRLDPESRKGRELQDKAREWLIRIRQS
jgi:tetratricopeptide (TPR) repeat protein